MIKIRCVVEHITYQNQENGYSVMRVKVRIIQTLLPRWATCWMYQWVLYYCVMVTGKSISDTDVNSYARRGKK